MLQRQIDILHNLLFLRHRLQKLVRQSVRVTIEHAQPLKAVNFAQAAHQLCKGIFAVQVNAVASRILRNKDELLRAVFNETARFFLNALHRAAAVAAADHRNRAVSTFVVAALCNLDVRKIARGRKLALAAQRHFALFGKTLRKIIHCTFNARRNVRVRADAEHTVHLGQLFVNFLAVALRKTSRHHNLLDAALFFQRRKLQNFIDGFLLRAVDKAAGIYDCNVCKRSVIAQLKARVFQARHQHFAVHLVFGTAKADHSHFNCHVYNPFSVHIQALDMPLYNFCSAATYFSRKRAAFQSKCRPFTKIIQLYAQKHACRPEIMLFCVAQPPRTALCPGTRCIPHPYSPRP